MEMAPNLQNVAKAVLRGKFIATWGSVNRKDFKKPSFPAKVLEKGK